MLGQAKLHLKQEVKYIIAQNQLFQYTLCYIISQICMQTGFLVRPIEAILVHQPQWQLKMDPFCRIFLGQQLHQTSICSQGGKNPKWGDTLLFTNTGDLDLRIQVWDSDKSNNSNQLIGSGCVKLSKIMTQGVGTATWIDLRYKGRNAGRICLGIQFNASGFDLQGKGQGISKQVGQTPGYVQTQGIGSESSEHPKQ